VVAEDRALRLKGYEVYRFGGYELGLGSAPAMLRQFFAELIGPGVTAGPQVFIPQAAADGGGAR
jgi:hypothetical protein